MAELLQDTECAFAMPSNHRPAPSNSRQPTIRCDPRVIIDMLSADPRKTLAFQSNDSIFVGKEDNCLSLLPVQRCDRHNMLLIENGIRVRINGHADAELLRFRRLSSRRTIRRPSRRTRTLGPSNAKRSLPIAKLAAGIAAIEPMEVGCKDLWLCAGIRRDPHFRLLS